MAVKTSSITVSAKPETDIIDITKQVSEIIEKSKIKNGIVTIFVPGSTASVSTIEFEPNLVKDVEDAYERLVPSDIKYKHTETWGDDNGKSHVKATITGPGITVPFEDKKMFLGTWQQIVVMDFDVPARERKVIIQVMGE
ncbi:MAG: secondary thiamine-phosphate synthase enzyme YjbQ [Nanoarchaeota archaeon]